MTLHSRTGRAWFVFISFVGSILLFSSTANAQAQRPLWPKAAQQHLTIRGAVAVTPLVTDIARRFEKLNPGVTIDVKSAGSGQGIADLRSGSAEIAMLPRALQNSERDLFAFPIARDGIAVVVNRDNPVRSISSQQLADLVTGQLSNWKALGGRDAPLDFAWRKGQGSVEFILTRLSLKAEQVGRHIDTPTDSAAIKFVASAANAVTLASVGESERSMRNGAAIKLLAFNGVPASSRAIQTHSYMLSRPLVLVTRHLPENLQKRFIDYALSSDVVDIELKYGFVPYQE